MRKTLIVAGAALASAALVLPSNAASKAPAARFGAPVRVTPPNGGGYEPTVVADRFGNLYATAHKENAELVVSPDERSQTATRSMSWAWWSRDNGATWQNLPLGPGDAYNKEFGDEGDMDVDEAGNVYFVDTTVADITFTQWHTTGRGETQFVRSTPLAGFGEPVDDRPWVVAHGDGHVFYFGNEGDSGTYPAGAAQGRPGSGYGPGRYTVYSSYDHGNTWDPIGYQLKGSGWCRPAADHRKGSKYLYAVCGNDGGADAVEQAAGVNIPAKGTLYAYVSADDGKTFERYTIGSYNGADPWATYPTVQVAKDGSIWAAYVDHAGTESPPKAGTVTLYHSTDHGKHWSKQAITPQAGNYRYGWLSVAPNGNLGFAVYYRKDKKQPWRVYGAVWKPGQRPVLTSLDEKNPVASADSSSPPGDFLTSYFTPDNKLNAVWTRNVLLVGAPPTASAYVYRDIYFARQR
ncbi:MAG TPA: sialidase family protein [Mycobacteriales bacterium]|nr:sialidase family protein [Mycobacteriales bacterium]